MCTASPATCKSMTLELYAGWKDCVQILYDLSFSFELSGHGSAYSFYVDPSLLLGMQSP